MTDDDDDNEDDCTESSIIGNEKNELYWLWIMYITKNNVNNKNWRL